MMEASRLTNGNFNAEEQELLQITWRMLNAIHTGDFKLYAEFSTDDLSCYEDVCAYRIDGLEFHLDLIQLMAENPANRPARFDMLTPRVQIYGETGIVTYTRLMTFDENGRPRWTTFNETRVYIKQERRWKMAHFHRSPT